MGAVIGKVSVETPAHTVVHTTDTYQIWRYPACIAATVHAADLDLPERPTERDFTSAAFRTLARYIGVFGDPQNRVSTTADTPRAEGSPREEAGEAVAMTAPVEVKRQKIAMTAPVEMHAYAQDFSAMKMSFFLPAKYTSVEQVPVPTNEVVKIVRVPARYDAVVAFSGNLAMGTSAEKARVLMEELREHGVEILGEWSYCGYNPPFTLPHLKRNEVHVPVEGGRFDSGADLSTQER